MILTKKDILQEVSFPNGLDQFQVNPCSIDLRIESDVFLQPGETVLVKTADQVGLSYSVMGVVYPRSSTNRRLIRLDMTGVVDPGYEGNLILPFTNLSDRIIKLYRGERLASIVFHLLTNKAVKRLSKYHKSDGEYIEDKSTEMDMLKWGRLDELKTDFKI